MMNLQDGGNQMVADGNTVAGSWPVHLEFTADEVEQLIRSIEAAALMSGSGKNSSAQAQDNLQIIAYREFLKKILDNLRQALEVQRPS